MRGSTHQLLPTPSPLVRVNIDALKVAEARLVEERARLSAVLEHLPVSVVMAEGEAGAHFPLRSHLYHACTSPAPSGNVVLWNKQYINVWRRDPSFLDSGTQSVLDGSFYAGCKGWVGYHAPLEN